MNGGMQTRKAPRGGSNELPGTLPAETMQPRAKMELPAGRRKHVESGRRSASCNLVSITA
jgi:hypothetical protein